MNTLGFGPRSVRAGVCVLAGAWVASLGCGRLGYAEPDPAPALEVDQVMVTFVAQVGELVPAVSVTLSDIHDQQVEWRGWSDAPWLELDPAEGTCPAVVRLSPRSHNLDLGAHQATVVFAPARAEDGVGSTTVVVHLQLSSPGWSAIPGLACGQVEDLVVDPENPNRVLVAAGHTGLFTSNDGGLSFQREAMELGSFDLARSFAFTSSDRAYLAMARSNDDYNGGGLWRSEDRGATWGPTALQNVDLEAVLTDPDDPDRVLARGGSLWSSPDGGLSWVEETTVSPSLLAAAPSGAGYWVGDTAGSLWSTPDGVSLTLLATPTTRRLESLAVATDGRVFLGVSGYPDELFVSSDGGGTWEQLPAAGMPHSSTHLRLAFEGDVLWAVDGGVYRSFDSGQSFQAVTLGVRDLVEDGRARGIALHPAGALFGHGSLGVVRYDPTEGLVPTAFNGCSVEALEWDAASATFFGATSRGGPFRVLPGGEVQGLGGEGLPVNEYWAIAPDPRNPAVTLLGGNSVLWLTYDSGATWTQGAVGIPSGNCSFDIERAPLDPDVIWIAGCVGFFRSTDNGATFTEVHPDGTSGQVAPVSSTVAFFTSSGLRRYDATSGETLQLSTSSPEVLTRTWDGSLWTLSYSSSLRRSVDDGETFVDLGLVGPSPRDLALHPSDPSRIYVAFAADVYVSRDNGGTWAPLGVPFSPMSIAFDGGGSLVVGTVNGGLFRHLPD